MDCSSQASCRVLFAAALCLLLGAREAAGAEPAPKDARTPRPASRAQLAFGLSDERLLPRIGQQLEQLSVAREFEVPGSDSHEPVFADELSRSVGRVVARSTRRAMKDYLIERTELDRRLDEWKAAFRRRHAAPEVAGTADAVGAAPDPRRVRFDVGLHHLRPQLEMHYEIGPGALRLRVDTGGVVKLGYGGERMGSSSLEASYDGEAIGLACSLGF